MSINSLLESPGSYDFFQAVYAIERQLSNKNIENPAYVGHDARPSEELIRFKTEQHLSFPGQAISNIKTRARKNQSQVAIDLYVSFMGLTGAGGVLPQHYSEMMLQRLKVRDTSMRDFFDLFNHRLISLFYRSWEKYRSSVHYQRNGKDLSDPFSLALLNLSGGSNALDCYYSGLRVNSVRSAQGLRQLIRHYLGCSIEIDEFQGHWSPLNIDDQTQLGSRANPEGNFARLGMDASIGGKAWQASGLNIKIALNENVSLNDLLPGTPLFENLGQVITDYIGQNNSIKIELQTTQEQLPIAQLAKPKSNNQNNKIIPLGQGCSLMSTDINKQKKCKVSLQYKS